MIWSQYNDLKYDFMFGGFVWNEFFFKMIFCELKYYDYLGWIVIVGFQVFYVERGELEKYYLEGDVFIWGYVEQVVLELVEGKDNILGVYLVNILDKGFYMFIKLFEFLLFFFDGILEFQYFMCWEMICGCFYSCLFCQYRDLLFFLLVNKSWIKIQYFKGIGFNWKLNGLLIIMFMILLCQILFLIC